MKDPIEQLAALEHSQWMEWAKTIIDKEPGLSEERKARWRTLFVPYEGLSEEMKDFDRAWAHKVVAILREAFRAQAVELSKCRSCGHDRVPETVILGWPCPYCGSEPPRGERVVR